MTKLQLVASITIFLFLLAGKLFGWPVVIAAFETLILVGAMVSMLIAPTLDHYQKLGPFSRH